MQYSSLSNLHISEGVQALSNYLESTGLIKADCIRLSFIIEEALLYYQEKLGEETPYSLIYGKKWGRDQFSIHIKGKLVNPFIVEEEDESPSITMNLMQKMGILPEWKYSTNERNIIYMALPKVPAAPLKKLFFAVLLSFIFYGLTFLFPDTLNDSLYSDVLVPTSNAFMSVLSALSGPIIFISILCSIINMGDIATFGKIGKQCITGFLITIVTATVISCFWLIFLYPIDSSAATQSTQMFAEILALFLDMVPTNIFVFSLTDINPMQTVLLASFLGVCILGLQKETPIVSSFVNQINLVLQCAMSFVTSYIHVFVFLCVSQLLLANQLNIILSSYRFFAYCLFSFILLTLFNILRVLRKTGCKPSIFISKMLPAFLIGLTTDSSSAAFTTNLNTCKKNYGIEHKLVDFAIPFGQVIYMPAFSLFMVVLSFFMCGIYGVDLSISMLFMIFFISIILCIAAPPIPGGGVAILSILFMQLALPDEGLGIAIVFLTICGSSLTAFNLFCLHAEIICTAKTLNLIDQQILQNKSNE
ncbi:MAG: cation:dicarboxylase symporter family transporter [Eubacteriales bacterium]